MNTSNTSCIYRSSGQERLLLSTGAPSRGRNFLLHTNGTSVISIDVGQFHPESSMCYRSKSVQILANHRVLL